MVMRLVIDYGGVLVDNRDEREYAHLLGVSPDEDPYPGWLAYFCYQAGFLDTQQQYLELLSTLTGAPVSACTEYLERTWLDPDFPAERRTVLADLAEEHTLVLLGNLVEPWVETVLERHDALDLFEEVLVSSALERRKPHPRGYVRALAGAEGEVAMVSDEYNEDLMMAECLGMTSIWVANEDDEEPYREPDYTIEDIAGIEPVLERIAAGR